MSTLDVRKALRAAYEEQYVPLLRLCVLLSGDRHAAEDIVQEAFVKAAPKIEDISPEHIAAYMRTIVVNLWRNRLRSLIRERRARDRSFLATLPEGLPHEDRAALRAAVLRLPKRQRACVVLRYYEDLPEREVASLLRCSVGTVKSQTSRALARLRKEFEGEG